MRGVKCWHCNKSLPKSAARIAVEHGWICEDCAYLREHPNAQRIEPPLRINRLRPQAEELFPGAA